ncbi:A/G-specific adenine glycosylase [Actibacterium atlanticum]|uniref:Adenine DNA glycosylase n=1 Tax=Actibacterium atlanticum TaxID=1461693 RepID=A0A058ZM75_9RHOB|nr:A/G-specific adenine glycosylase [Actibacterium atlanticum]KCV82282.1 A/G-specific adenine glycosylase [Actibacterium atlanticum]
MRDEDYSQELLHWYDRHAREMPWRVGPGDLARGERPDPYHVWMSEVMLQQTTVVTVRDYFLRFTARWPSVTALAAAADEDVMGEWAGLGYYARARNLLKCARVITKDHGGVFPDTEEALRALPGIGPYTAAAVSAIAFDRAAVVVDGNVERVMARLFAVLTPLPTAKAELTDLAARLTPDLRPGCHAQAVMDLGATICTPKSPACGICPVKDGCQARTQGIQADLPRKLPKKPKPTRYGTAYVAQTESGGWVLERRPEKGLLGGMLGWPGTDWSEDAPPDSPPFDADWQELGAEVRHTFTHFHLRLRVKTALLPQDIALDARYHLLNETFRPSDLPTVMRKAFDLTRSDA